MLLKNLIKKKFAESVTKLNIKGLTTNSKAVKKGFIFFAIKGHNSNGENYIKEAIKKGASVIVCAKNCKFKNDKTIIIKTKKIRNYLSEIASKFYNLKPKNIIAVTGTNGKTSVADFFYQILNLNRIPAASIGTLGVKYKNKLIKTHLTSPDTITLHKFLEKIKKNGVDNVIIEASSHGLDQNRLDHLNLKGGIFTNLSQDHLDYHKTMKAYLKAKLILFSKLLSKKNYIISDQLNKEYITLEKISKKRNLKLLNISKVINHIKNIHLNFKGSFQIKNLSMAIMAAHLCGLNYSKIINSLKNIKSINGRLELIKKYKNDIQVFIDYAHTPEALSEVLKSLKRYNKKITLIFGCGGERDFTKRSLMAKIAKHYCNKIYVTDDNPRSENPKKIRKEITKYLKGSNYYDIGNRSKAIKEAILKANSNEIILIAGKGHEDYQNYGNRIILTSDKKIVKKIKRKKNAISKKNQNLFSNAKILNKIIKGKKLYKFNSLTIDSRQVKKNNLFLAIKGKNNDGNRFIEKAIRKGASYVVSSKDNKKFRKKIIRFSDPLILLNKFAVLKREYCSAKIIAITGSAGKTSLKNIISSLLNFFGDTYASPKSYNNHLGVPISLSNLNLNHKFGVFEAGMNKAGEINQLTKMIKPNLAIITNVAEAHIKNFNNIRSIAKAKSEIIYNVQNNGTVILNRDDKFFNYLSDIAKSKNLKILTFGKSKKSDVYPIKVSKLGEIFIIKILAINEIVELKIKDINIYNVLASLCVLKEMNLNLHKVLKLYKSFKPSDGRGKIHKIKRYKKNFKLIDESYNANPFSVKNALINFSTIKKNNFKKYLLLGDMLELGKKSDIYHKNLSQIINNSDIDKVFIKGKKTLITYKNLTKKKRGNIFQCNQDIDFIFKNLIANNDYLMIKGSNATGLKNISNNMIKES